MDHEQLIQLEASSLTEAQRNALIQEFITPHLREELGNRVDHNHQRDGYKGFDFDLSSPNVEEYFEEIPPESKYQDGFDLKGEVDALTDANYLLKRDTYQACPARADVRVDTNGQPRFTVRFEGVKYVPIDPPNFQEDLKELPHGNAVFSIIQLTKTHSAVPLHPDYRIPSLFNVHYQDTNETHTYECQVLPERFPETNIHLQHFFWEYFSSERAEFVKLSDDFRLLVHSDSIQEHVDHLGHIFGKFEELQYPFTFGKSKFFQPEVEWK